ncbi:hypothetical protein BpHYR1_020767 [Brachionus plicatilis]|uniref:Uncharacterized protein n=1 Tax=Brachionus plicatilis TaxID=10195 RepID=A0A3M7PFT5_BRAPC|nr:hypothetical protein BpHYR1_020767 [Brachionus plicatilis]
MWLHSFPEATEVRLGLTIISNFKIKTIISVFLKILCFDSPPLDKSLHAYQPVRLSSYEASKT